MRWVALFALALAVTSCQGEQRDAPEATEHSVAAPELRDELLAMTRVDRELRSNLTAERMQDTTLVARMFATQRQHAARMGEILDVHGWPGSALVGDDGAEAAWLLVQHGGPELQERALQLLDTATAPGVTPADMAMLEDRVRVAKGKPQRYGTQFSVEGGDLVLDPLENPDSVDVWRSRAGLGPLDEYVARAREAADSVR